MKKIIIICLSLALTLTGCGGEVITEATLPLPQEQPTNNVTKELPVEQTKATETSHKDAFVLYDAIDKGVDKGLWMRGSEVFIKDLFPGCCPGSPIELEVGNGIQEGISREIYIKVAPEDDKDLKGYEQLPEEYYDWFEIDKTVFVLEPGESEIVHVTITMPKGTDYSKKKARCEILVLGYTIVGTTVNDKGEVVNLVSNVPIGVASEWYIETY